MGSLFEIKNSIEKDRFQEIHEYSLKVLEHTGMKFPSDEILEALGNNGAKINWSKCIARIPSKLVENMLAELKKEIREGKKQIMLNGGVSFKTDEKIVCKFGAAAPNIYDWNSKKKREATDADLINAIRLGQATEEIGMVGCPMYCKEIDGKKIDPNFTPIINAMLLAKNTTKLGNSEVNSPKQLKYLIEMGIVVRGSLAVYKKNPCFITAKESISPLALPKNACDVLVALAKNGLPAIMIPMPIIGASTPVSVAGTMIVNNAEILGTMTAIRCIVADAIVGGGSIASVMDMRSGNIKFDTIASTKLDVAMTQMYEELYGLDYGYGVYCSDAKFLGPEIIYERIMKILGSALVKRFNYVIGLYDQGMIFSPELALVEVDIIKSLHFLLEDIGNNDLDLVLDTINRVGPGGNFMAEKHTLDNFKRIWRSEILLEVVDTKNDKKIKGMFDMANEKYKDILKNTEPYRLPVDKEKEIDSIVSRAYEDIVGKKFVSKYY